MAKLGSLFLMVAGCGLAQRTLHYEPLRSLPAEEKRWALLVGVDRYDDKQMSGLDGGTNDAKALARLLVERCGFREDHVVVLASDEPAPRQPTRAEILFRLGNMLQQVPRDGLFLLSFSGHGMERGGRAFLLPSDARLSDDFEILQQVSLDVETVRQIIARQGIQQVLILLDACRNDPGGRAESVNPLGESFVRGFNFNRRNQEVQAFATLYSTAVGDRAWENKEKKQGYFTWAIGEALNGRAANERGEITLAALVRYVQSAVPLRVALDLGSGKRQRPFARIEGYRAEELVLGLAPRSTAPPAAPMEQTDDEAVYWKQCELRGGAFCRIYLQRFPSGRFAPLANALSARAAEPAAAQPEPPKPAAPAEASPAHAASPGLATDKDKLTSGAAVIPVERATAAAAIPPSAPPLPAPGQPEPAPAGAALPTAPPRRDDPPLAPSLRHPGEGQRNPRDKLVYVWIPPGQFQMGCAGGGCAPGEQPRHSVQLTNGFWMGKTEVTIEAYQRFRKAVHAAPLPERDQRGNLFNEAVGNAKLPAVAVTWEEARRYCEWAGMRLPTEAEWEYAATAGTTPSLSSLDPVAWYADNAGRARIDANVLWRNSAKPQEYYHQIAANGNGPKPVGLKSPNPWGLHDMLGNVSEWVADWYAVDAYRTSPPADPAGAPQGQQRVLRGGGWLEPAPLVTYTRRSAANITARASWVGFRCAGKGLP